MTPTRMVLLGSMMLASAARAGDDQTLYAMGAILGQRARGYGFSAKELARTERGFADAAAGRELKFKDRDLEEWGPRVDALLQKRGNPRIAAEKERGIALASAEAKVVRCRLVVQ